MKIIAKGRGKGKTTELIKMSAEKQIPIVCMIGSIQYIIDKAKEMGLTIPKPLTVQQLNMTQWKDKPVLVDNAEFILQTKLGHKIEAITLNSDDSNELVTDDIKDIYSDAIKGLKEDEQKLSDQLKTLVHNGKHNEYIACLKALKETMNLIHEYDWQPHFSKYRTEDANHSNGHYEVSTWEQNSDNEIRNHKRYELKSPEDLNKSERTGVSYVDGKKHIMTNDEMDEFENRFDKEMDSMENMFRDNFRIMDNMNKYFESCFVPSKLFENK